MESMRGEHSPENAKIYQFDNAWKYSLIKWDGSKMSVAKLNLNSESSVWSVVGQTIECESLKIEHTYGQGVMAVY